MLTSIPRKLLKFDPHWSEDKFLDGPPLVRSMLSVAIDLSWSSSSFVRLKLSISAIDLSKKADNEEENWISHLAV